MSNKPTYSIIVPTYNRENLLKRAIDSILSQTFRDFELIIIDDGSTDNTKEVVETYKDDRIIYIYKENGGINSARNRGLKVARGEYIAFCDSDDDWLPEKLEKHMKKYQEDSEIKVVYELTGIVEKENGEEKIILARSDVCEGWCYKEVLEQGFLTSPTFLSCKKECFDKIGMLPMDLSNCEDDEFCFQLCKYFKVGLVKEILGIYREDANNRISSDRKLCADDFFKFQEKWSEEVRRICGNKVLSRRYFQASYNYLEISEIDKAKRIYQTACNIRNISMEKIRNDVRKILVDDEIVIYGIGELGKKVYNALKIVGFNKFIFVVSDTMYSVTSMQEMDVRAIGTLDTSFYKSLIVSSAKYYNEMKEIALKKGFQHIISYKKILNMIFDMV